MATSMAELFRPCKEMGDVEGVEDEEECEDGGVDVEIPLGPGPLQVDERRNHWVTDQPEKGHVYVCANANRNVIFKIMNKLKKCDGQL